jgi:hypothetical protein
MMFMKKNIFKSLALVCICLGLIACDKKFGEGVKLEGIEVGPDLSLNLGTTAMTPAYPIPWDNTDYEFAFSSSDPEVATVDAYGKIMAVGTGDATITITCAGFSKSVNVNVYEITIGQKCQEIPGLVGLWEFNQPNPLKATVGADLIAYHHGRNELGTTEGAENDYAPHPGFNKNDGAIKTVDFNPAFYCKHGLSSGSTYTILIDALRPESSGGKYTTLINTDVTNTGDQVVYWRREGYLQVDGSANRSSQAIQNDKWYRTVIVKNGSSYLRSYVNSVLWKDGGNPSAAVFDATAILLNADNDGDDRSLHWSTVAIFDRALTETEIAVLGGL